MKIYNLIIVETLEGDQTQVIRVTPFANQDKAREELTKEYDKKMASLLEPKKNARARLLDHPELDEELTEEDFGISSAKFDDCFEIRDDWDNSLEGEIIVADLVV
jgi:hypothetical protein